KLDWVLKVSWKRYLFAVVALMTACAIGFFPPRLVGYEIDHIQFETLTLQLLIAIIGGSVALLVSHYVLGFLWDYMLFGGAAILERWMRSKMMDHFLQMAPPFFSKYRTGDLMARSTNDLKAISMTAGFGILTLVDS